jgi:hypothetical protein
MRSPRTTPANRGPDPKDGAVGLMTFVVKSVARFLRR